MNKSKPKMVYEGKAGLPGSAVELLGFIWGGGVCVYALVSCCDSCARPFVLKRKGKQPDYPDFHSGWYLGVFVLL